MERFAIVTYLDKDLDNKVRELQKELFELTGSKGCLEIWDPHYTVGAGVSVAEDDLEQLFEDMGTFTGHQKTFKVEVDNFDFMDNWSPGKLEGYTTNVIYINVVVNDDLLNLVSKIEEKVTNKRDKYYEMPQPYNPHITIAFKDLTDEGFRKAKDLLEKREFQASAIADHVSLVTEDKNGKWSEYKRFNFCK